MAKKPTYEELEQRIKELENEVSDHKQAEEVLLESAKEYRSTLNDLLVGVVVHASDTSILLSNPEATNILGLTYDQMLGKKAIDPAWHFVHEDSTVMKVEDYPVSRVLSTRAPIHNYVVGINRSDRNFVTWVVVNAIPVFSENKELEKVVVNFVDITSHRQAEEALRESEEKYRSIFESATDALLIIDYDGNIVEANPQACEMYGYPPEEMVGLAGKNAVHPDYYYVFEELKKDVQEKGEFYAEAVHLRKDGSPISIEVRGGPFLYKGKQHLLMVDRDISDRKQAEEALRENKRNYQQQSKVLEGINRVFREALTCESEKEVADTCLSVAEELTGSKFGLIGEKNPEGRFDTIAISNPGWDACKMPDSEATILIQNMKIRGIDRSTIREEKSRIVNDPTSHPDRVGTPEGHPPISSFLGVPLKYAGKTIGMIGLGNKESGYDRFDQQAIEDLSVAFVEALMRKRAEEALRKSEANLSQAQQMAHIGNWNWNIVKNEISWSDEIYRIVGLSRQQFGANYEAYLQCIHPDDLETFKNITKNVLRDKKPYTAEYRIIRPNGDVRTVQELGEVTVDTNGDPIKLFGTAQDVTERKQEEEQYRTIIQTAIDGFCIVDTKGGFLDVNDAACRMLGYQREELLVMLIPGVDVSETAEEIREHIQKSIEQGYDSFETQLRRKDGTIIDVQISVQYLNLRGGVFIAFIRDITEEKRRGRALQESEEKFRTVADFNYDWESWVGPDGKYIYVSPSCERITGYSAGEFLKDSGLFTRIVHPDDLESVSVHVKGHLEGTGDNHIDFRIITKEGDMRWISHYCQPVYDKEGNWLGMRASNRDITDRIKLSEQLTQSQKMEAVGRLAGGVAHDFNNLLMTIIGYADLMLMDLAKDDPFRKRLEQIKGGGKSAARLTRQLLAFSRKQILQPVVLDLNELIKGFVKMLERLIGEDVELKTVLVSGLRQVEADPGQMEQIIMNLVINARDAMPGGGKLTIETANADLDEDYAKAHDVSLQPGPYVMLAVSDTGTGMDEETRSNIFEPFFTTKEVGKGTGLGLSTVYGIVKQSGGYIWVYSEPGQGTTFKIYLPEAEGEPVQVQKEKIPSGDLTGSETVLIVEDDDMLRNLAREILEAQGYRILVAENGIEALRISEEHGAQIHLMITDVVMPKMGGKEVAERLQPRYPEMKMIYMSGFTDNSIAHYGVLAPGLNFLQKPFSPETMTRKVREVLDKKQD